MPRIICRYEVCVFNKDSLCTSKEIEYDPDQGCLTAQDRAEFAGVLDDEDEFDDEEELEAEEDDVFDADELDEDEDDADEFFRVGELEDELDEDDDL